ncbi:hypothetical protein [Limnovirga soli]|uniref:Uncharacterized protein n=1 Tax=Limnovirga soli TaxID=2656915 RepID=A0A8J8JZ41_9BACT|nr:hypothetical protein [Limnovirga soli]NNV57951.1 hypothetical protein [Limnovirga soli]
MKTLITIIAFLTLTISAIGQRRVSYRYTEINKTQFDSCVKTSYIIANPQIKKQAGKLTIPVSGKDSKIFKDDNSDENFYEFDYLGIIKGTKLSLVKRTDYNSEEFYLINGLTGTIDTLIGQPVFAQNMRDFACINNPGTDEEQQIQVCEIKNGVIKKRLYLNGKKDTLLENISFIYRNSILTKDNKGKYWQLKFKIGEE